MKTILAALLVLVSFSSFADVDYSKEAMDARCGNGQVMIYWNKIIKKDAEVKVCLKGDIVTGGIYSEGGENMVYTSPIELTHVQVTPDYEAVIVQELPMALRFAHMYDGKADYLYLFNMGTESETSRPVALDPTMAYSNIIGLREAKRDRSGISRTTAKTAKVERVEKAIEIPAVNGAGDRCAPGDVVYYAKTAKGNKEVLICKLDTNIAYSFGKIGKEPDLYLKRDLTEIGASGETAVIINGDISYHVGYEDGHEVLVVVKGSETLANIALDQRSVYNGIRSELTN